MKQLGKGVLDRSFGVMDEEDAKVETTHNDVFVEQPIIELSFSDLSEFTDTSDEDTGIKENTPQETQIAQMEELNEDEILTTINIYNSKFKYIYEIVRIELGDLANEFLYSSLNKAKINFPLLFDNVKHNEFGGLDEDTLKNNIMGNIVVDYKEGLDLLINIQLSIIEKFLESSRVQEIKNIINEI